MDEWATTREVDQRFADMAQRVNGIETRLTGLAQDAVTVTVWSQEKDHVRDLIAGVEKHSKERHEELLEAVEAVRQGITRRSEWTWSRALAVASIAATVVVGWVTVVLTTKGIK